MKGKKLKALALLSAAVMALANITASAYVPTIWGFENIEKMCDETIDTHLCRNYINFDLDCGTNKGKKLVIKDQAGDVVAKYTTGAKKFSFVRESVLDISGMISPKQIDALKTDSEYVTRALHGEHFVMGKECQVSWKNEYLPNVKEAGGSTDVYPLLTSDIYVYAVDNKAGMEETNDTYTVKAGDYAAFVAPGCVNIDNSMYFNFKTFDSKIFCEHAGEFMYDHMQADTYSPDIEIYTERTEHGSQSSGSTIRDGIVKQDHDITYKMYKIKFEDLIEYYLSSSDYEKYLNYSKQPGRFAVLFASGSMMSYVTPDSDGYMKFWADPNHLGSVQFMFMAKDFTSASNTLTLYKVVKINMVMEMPKSGLTLYNIPAGTYKVEFEDPADNDKYHITNNTFTVTDSTMLQTAEKITVQLNSSSSTPDSSKADSSRSDNSVPDSSSSPDRPTYKPGDVNADGSIDIEDAVMVINHVNGMTALTDDETKRADIDGNSDIDIEDAVAIISHVNGVTPIA